MEPLKEIKLFLAERSSSPLLRTFIGSWCIVNYKLFFVFFSGDSAATKLAVINETLYPVWYVKISCWLLAPAIITTIFLLWYPAPAVWITNKWTDFQNRLKEAEGKALLTTEQSNEIRREIAQLKTTHRQAIVEKDVEISALKSALDDAETLVENVQKEHDRLVVLKGDFENAFIMKQAGFDSLPKDATRIINLFDPVDEPITFAEIDSRLPDLGSEKIKYYLTILKDNDWITSPSAHLYLLSPSGQLFMEKRREP